jgi:hypothetical protein
MTFCPQNPNKYCAEPTLKSRLQEIEDWKLLFRAVIRQRPTDIRAEDTIEHTLSIFKAADAAVSRLKK